MTRAHRRLLTAGAAILALLVLAAVLAPVLAPFAPQTPVGQPFLPPSATHWLGTNDIGQDIASQVIWGARAALAVAIVAAATSVTIGVLVGAIAGLAGGAADLLLMRSTDVFLAVPGLPLLILVVALAGPGRATLVVVIALFSWPWTARIVRGQVLSLRSRGFVRAASGFGAHPWHVLRRHLLPAVAPLAAAGFVQVAGVAIVLDAGLAFLGLADPTTVSWGLMLNRAVTYPGVYLSDVWLWWVAPPGLAVTLAVLASTYVGMGLSGGLPSAVATASRSGEAPSGVPVRARGATVEVGRG